MNVGFVSLATAAQLGRLCSGLLAALAAAGERAAWLTVQRLDDGGLHDLAVLPQPASPLDAAAVVARSAEGRAA